MHPDKLTKWLYREVLHADLDDPYLGLGKALFENYPMFNKSRRKSLRRKGLDWD